MIKYKSIFFACSLLLLFGCKHFQTQMLTDEHQIALEEPAEKGVPANQYKGGMLFNFKEPINKWWVANTKLAMSKVGDTLKVQLKDCGLKYECWGTELDELLDFTNSPVLKVTARSEGATVPTLGISLKDMDGFDTSLDRPSQKIEKSDEYIEYYFNYNKKWTHWEGKKPVDPAGIIEILFFVNPGQMNWTGTIYIDDIQVITLDEMPSEDEIKQMRRARRDAQRKAAQGSTQAPTSPEPVKAESEDKKVEKVEEVEEVVSKAVEASQNIADVTTPVVVQERSAPARLSEASAKSHNWWRSNDSKMSFESIDKGAMKISLQGVGPAFESFGFRFETVDFTKTPVLKVRARSEGETPDNLRVDLRDIGGFITNSKPNVKVFKVGTDFVDYYYDFTEKFYQNYPNVQIVDASQIIEVLFFVNPGGKAYTGSVTIDEIEAISIEDYKKVKK